MKEEFNIENINRNSRYNKRRIVMECVWSVYGRNRFIVIRELYNWANKLILKIGQLFYMFMLM